MKISDKDGVETKTTGFESQDIQELED